MRQESSRLVPKKAILKLHFTSSWLENVYPRTVRTARTALGKVGHYLELIFLAQIKYFFLFLLLLLECKTYRKSGGEVLIADLGIAGN